MEEARTNGLVDLQAMGSVEADEAVKGTRTDLILGVIMGQPGRNGRPKENHVGGFKSTAKSSG